MRAERDRRAAILTAEGSKQSQILNAEGEKQAAVLTAEGQKTAAILRAEGEAKAIDTVFQAIHAGDPDEGLLSYQYLQMLPKLAQGDANKIFVIPSEFSQALGHAAGAIAGAVRPSPAEDAAGAVSAYIVDDAVEDYAAAHTTPPAEHLRALAAETRETLSSPQMLTGDIEGRFLEFLVYLAQPRLVLEIGTYSGYSALSMAGALRAGRADRRPASCSTSTPTSPSGTSPARARPVASRSAAGRRSTRSRRSTARSTSSSSTPTRRATSRYYEAVLPKLSARGLIVVDNVLWSGRVAVDPSGDDSASTIALRAFNDHVAADPRVANCMLTVRDGIMLVRRA